MKSEQYISSQERAEQHKEELAVAVEEAIKEDGREMPPGPYQNKIEGWWFSNKEIEEANKNDKMLTLDLDVGKACNLDCGYCFAQTQCEQRSHYVKETTERVIKLLDEAADLGVKSIKIVGAGEPTMFPGLIKVLEHAHKLGIESIIFTGGHILGADGENNMAKKAFKSEGINDGLELAKRLKDLGASFVVKFLTFDPELQQRLVEKEGKPLPFDYVSLRDKGLINLVKLGLNKESVTRLGVDCLLMKQNYKEAVDLFKFFNERNIFCVLNGSMDCGNTTVDVSTFDDSPYILNPEVVEYTALALYKYCKENNIPYGDRISPYFTSPVCSQLNHGMFVGDNGDTKVCPGGPIVGKYKSGNLKEIWESNDIRKRCKGCNGHECISRAGKTYPVDLEGRVKTLLDKDTLLIEETEKPA